MKRFLWLAAKRRGYFFCCVALLPGLAFGQVVNKGGATTTAPTFTSTKTTGNGFVAQTGGKVCFTGSSCNVNLNSDSANLIASGAFFDTSTIQAGLNSTNTITLGGSGSGSPVTATAAGADANVGISLVTKGTGNVSVPILFVNNTAGGGTLSLTAGSATAAVNASCRAICTDTTAVNAVKCSVSGTTLTVTGTGTDSINYFCF